MTCSHLRQVADVQPATTEGCVDCLRSGDEWTHLRLCMHCGHVGCCDSSKHRHASAHARQTKHPVVQSYEPDEDWYYCYVDDESIAEISDLPSYSHADSIA